MLNVKSFLRSPYSANLSGRDLEDFKILTKIFPFKVSKYVLDELIDWSDYRDDPIFRLVFPVREMLDERHWSMLRAAGDPKAEREIIKKIRLELNPHPSGQQKNIPRWRGQELGGIQHKYRETVLFFPAQGQTCHTYCTYCFRWAQFVNLDEHKFRSKDAALLRDYLAAHSEVTDLLFTGGDPMHMSNEHFFEYLDVLLDPELEHVQNIRIGTKALAYYPMRFLGPEGEIFLEKLKTLKENGRHVALMAHFSHPRELQTDVVRQAIERIRAAGITIRTQSPLVRPVNASADIWADMWREQVKLDMIPYYMFVERDTGAHGYFSVPLAEALEIYNQAMASVSGLIKTVRGPSMSADPGKVLVDGLIEVGGKKLFVLKFIQARNRDEINKIFFAEYDPHVSWWEELKLIDFDAVTERTFQPVKRVRRHFVPRY